MGSRRTVRVVVTVLMLLLTATVPARGQQRIAGGPWIDGLAALGAPMNPKALYANSAGIYLSSAPPVGPHRVGLIAPNGTITTLVTGLNGARAIVVDAAGNLYIADTGNYRILKQPAGGGPVTVITGTGTQGSSGDGGPAQGAGIGLVYGLAISPDGSTLAFPDMINGKVRLIRLSDMTIRSVPGLTGGSPAAVAYGPDGTLYVVELMHRVRAVAPDGAITVIAGNGSPGFSGDGGPATSAQLNQPFWVVLRGPVLFVGEIANMRVRAIDLTTRIITTALAGVSITSLTATAAGLVYGGDGNAGDSVYLAVPGAAPTPTVPPTVTRTSTAVPPTVVPPTASRTATAIATATPSPTPKNTCNVPCV